MNNISPQWTRAKSNAWLAFASFLVWPFLSLVYAIANWRSPWAKNIVWLFCGFFGFTFVISGEGVDANRYRDSLFELRESKMNFLDYFEKVRIGELSRGDYIEPMLRYIVSLITSDYRLLFALFGLVFGYFYSRNIWILLDQCGGWIKHHAYPFIILFIFLVPFWLINGFRFWTATHIFVYAIFQLYLFKRYWASSFIFLLSILMHTAFMFPVFLIGIFYLIPKADWIFLIIFLASLLFIRLDLSFFVSLIPEQIEGPQINLVRGYLIEEYALTRARESEALNWYIKYRGLPIYIYTLFVSVLLLTQREKHLNISAIRQIFYFGLFVFCVANVINVIPSASRFYKLAYLCIFGALFLMVHRIKPSRDVQMFFWTSTLFFMLPIIVELRLGLSFIGPGTLLLNPIFAWIFENKYAFFP